MKQNLSSNKSFLSRFYIYQKERFPFVVHGIIISIFTFSSISYSRICRRELGFISWIDFWIGVFATISLFFLVRIFDEFKDKDEDAKYRSYLPVPRGLISFNELKITGIIVVILQVMIIAIFQLKMLYLYIIVLVYLAFMGVEFFVPEWLKKRQIIYITSHMVIIPLIDIYSSGLDWLLDSSNPHWGLAWFFAVSYVNGIVLEFGRKLRIPSTEEEGVVSYTKLYGTVGGTLAWILLMFLTLILAIGASYYAEYGFLAYIILICCFLICSLPGWLFIINPTEKKTKYIEHASALWTATLYLALGGIPMIKSIL